MEAELDRRRSETFVIQVSANVTGELGESEPEDGGPERDMMPRNEEGWDMAQRWMAIIIGLTLTAALDLGWGPEGAEGGPAGETGGRHLGSRVAAGIIGNHTCAVKEDGNALCWGSNTSGQLS